MRVIDSQIQVYLEWLEYVKRRTPVTVHTYRQKLERFTRQLPELDDFTKLTNWQLDEWRAGLAKKGLAGKTINGYTDPVTSCLTFLVKQRKSSVAFDFDTFERADEDDPDVFAYTEKEFARALQSCRGLRDWLILTLIFQSGVRREELATLRVEDIKVMELHIYGKGRKRRTTFIREDVRAALDKWLALNEITEGWVFPSPIKWGEHLSSDYFRQIVETTFKRAGVTKKGNPHAIRRSFFTVLLTNGAPLPDVSLIGGHSDPRTTQKYYKFNPKHQQKIHAKHMPDTEQLAADKV